MFVGLFVFWLVLLLLLAAQETIYSALPERIREALNWTLAYMIVAVLFAFAIALGAGAGIFFHILGR